MKEIVFFSYVILVLSHSSSELIKNIYFSGSFYPRLRPAMQNDHQNL